MSQLPLIPQQFIPRQLVQQAALGPTSTDSPVADPPASILSPRRLGRRKAAYPKDRVLVIEDDPGTAKALLRLLEQEGYEVRHALDGGSAIKIACSWIPDVLICDIRLPDRDGCDVMRIMRRACPNLAGVAVSGAASPGQVVRSRAAGFVDHLQKPFEFSVLHGAIRAALKGE